MQIIKEDFETVEKYTEYVEQENIKLRERVKNLEYELALAKREKATGKEFLLEDEYMGEFG